MRVLKETLVIGKYDADEALNYLSTKEGCLWFEPGETALILHKEFQNGNLVHLEINSQENGFYLSPKLLQLSSHRGYEVAMELESRQELFGEYVFEYTGQDNIPTQYVLEVTKGNTSITR